MGEGQNRGRDLWRPLLPGPELCVGLRGPARSPSPLRMQSIQAKARSPIACLEPLRRGGGRVGHKRPPSSAAAWLLRDAVVAVWLLRCPGLPSSSGLAVILSCSPETNTPSQKKWAPAPSRFPPAF